MDDPSSDFTTQSIEPGALFIVNAATQQAIDVKLSNNSYSLAMSESKKEWTEKWECVKSGDYYKLRSKASGLFISTSAPQNGTVRELTLSDAGTEFDIQRPTEGEALLRISVANKPRMVLELSDSGVLQVGESIRNSKKTQRWIISRSPTPITPGTYYVCNIMGESTLDLEATSTIAADHNPVRCYHLTGNSNQQWEIKPGEVGYRIRSVASGTYVGYHAGLKISDTMTVTGNANPVEWEIHRDVVEGYVFFVIDKRASMVLDLFGGKHDEGTDIVFSPWSATSRSQKWIISSVPDVQSLKPKYVGPLEVGGTIRIRLVQGGTYFGASGGQQLSVYALRQDHAPSQAWMLEPGVGGYQIKHTASGGYVAVGWGNELVVTPTGQEFLFDGNSEDGYFILDAQNPLRHVETRDHKNPVGTALLLVPGRLQKWAIEPY